jgi:hypothetical protein
MVLRLASASAIASSCWIPRTPAPPHSAPLILRAGTIFSRGHSVCANARTLPFHGDELIGPGPVLPL